MSQSAREEESKEAPVSVAAHAAAIVSMLQGSGHGHPQVEQLLLSSPIEAFAKYTNAQHAGQLVDVARHSQQQEESTATHAFVLQALAITHALVIFVVTTCVHPDGFWDQDSNNPVTPGPALLGQAGSTGLRNSVVGVAALFFKAASGEAHWKAPFAIALYAALAEPKANELLHVIRATPRTVLATVAAKYGSLDHMPLLHQILLGVQQRQWNVATLKAALSAVKETAHSYNKLKKMGRLDEQSITAFADSFFLFKQKPSAKVDHAADFLQKATAQVTSTAAAALGAKRDRAESDPDSGGELEGEGAEARRQLKPGRTQRQSKRVRKTQQSDHADFLVVKANESALKAQIAQLQSELQSSRSAAEAPRALESHAPSFDTGDACSPPSSLSDSSLSPRVEASEGSTAAAAAAASSSSFSLSSHSFQPARSESASGGVSSSIGSLWIFDSSPFLAAQQGNLAVVGLGSLARSHSCLYSAPGPASVHRCVYKHQQEFQTEAGLMQQITQMETDTAVMERIRVAKTTCAFLPRPYGPVNMVIKNDKLWRMQSAYAQEWVRGVELSMVLHLGNDDDPLRGACCPADQPASRADLGRQIAEAVQHLHALGIVHRDIKPSNVVVSSPAIMSWMKLHSQRLALHNVASPCASPSARAHRTSDAEWTAEFAKTLAVDGFASADGPVGLAKPLVVGVRRAVLIDFNLSLLLGDQAAVNEMEWASGTKATQAAAWFEGIVVPERGDSEAATSVASVPASPASSSAAAAQSAASLMADDAPTPSNDGSPLARAPISPALPASPSRAASGAEEDSAGERWLQLDLFALGLLLLDIFRYRSLDKDFESPRADKLVAHFHGWCVQQLQKQKIPSVSNYFFEFSPADRSLRTVWSAALLKANRGIKSILGRSETMRRFLHSMTRLPLRSSQLAQWKEDRTPSAKEVQEELSRIAALDSPAAIAGKLKGYNLKAKECGADGNCFFLSAVDQAEQHQSSILDRKLKGATAFHLRAALVAFIARDPVKCYLRCFTWLSADEWELQVGQLKKVGVWDSDAGDFLVPALALFWGAQILVIEGEQSDKAGDRRFDPYQELDNTDEGKALKAHLALDHTFPEDRPTLRLVHTRDHWQSTVPLGRSE